jgi:hypothetical protein
VKNANLQGEAALVQGMPCRSGAQTLQRGGSELVRCVRVMCDTALQAPPVCECVCPSPSHHHRCHYCPPAPTHAHAA